LFSSPLYGGTDHFIHHFLPKIGVNILGFKPGQSKDELIELVEESGMADQLKLVYVETPANPTNDIIDIASCSELAEHFSKEDKEVLVAVDNTYMGPLWQHPLELGADLVIYSATKYIGGHSDVIAGAVLGNEELMERVKTLRTFLGNMAGPYTGWLLMRSLETLKVRMEQQQENAVMVADYLKQHDKVRKVLYLGLIPEDSDAYRIYKKQYSGPGAMLSFKIKGGEKEAFRFLNSLKLMKLAVSLGGTESLAEHPKTMTHAGVEMEHLEELGVDDSLIRLSIGVENAEDIIWDIEQALEKV
jgi:methionine-gamma-lyase